MKIHVVKKGDTLFEIAKKHGVGLEQLIAANPQIADPDRIEAGMKVKIPMAPKPVPQPPVEYSHKVTVAQGNTLWQLSKVWNVPLKALIDANPHLKNPSVLLTGDTVYIPKVKTDGTLIAMGKEGMTAPLGKANTAPIGKANTAPVGKADTAPVAEAPAAEKPAAPAAEKPAAPVNEKPAAPVNEKPVAPVNEKPVAPVNEKPVAPIAEKPLAPVAEHHKAPAHKPETPNKLPVLESMMEAQKPNFPPVAAPLTTGSNPAPAAEAAKDLPKPVCPPLPLFQNPYDSYPQIPVFPQEGAGGHWPGANHPFAQDQVPAVEAMAYANPAWSPMAEEECYPYNQQPLWPYAVSPYAQHPVHPYPAAYPGGWMEPDCGCGGDMPNLPYAWVPSGNEQPDVQGANTPYQAMAADPNQAPVAGMPNELPNVMPYMAMPYAAMPNAMPNAMPYAAMPHAMPNAMPYAMPNAMPNAMPYPAMGYGWPEQGGMQPDMAGAAGEPLQTYATPYANPYAFPAFEPHQAPHAGAFQEQPDRLGETQEEGKSGAGKNTKKTVSARSTSSARAEQSPLQAFVNRQRAAHNGYSDIPRNSRPWINL